MRHSNALLGNRAYATDTTNPAMVDATYGGNFGFMPDYTTYVASTPYVRRNLIARLVEAPRGFLSLPDSDKRTATLKALVELHPTSITGFNGQLTVEARDTPYGGAGEVMEAPANVTRARPTPSFNYTERYGRPISRFFDDWIINLIMDPETKHAGVLHYDLSEYPADLLPDYIGMTVLFFEPDPTHRRIDKAWLTTNMWPKSGAPSEAQRNLTAGGDSVEFAIEFTSLSMVGVGVNQFAQEVLKDMTLTGASPQRRPAFIDKINPDVLAGEKGYKEQLVEAAKVAVK